MPRPSASPATMRSSGAETAAARVTTGTAASPRSPSHFASALPPSETPAA